MLNSVVERWIEVWAKAAWSAAGLVDRGAALVGKPLHVVAVAGQLRVAQAAFRHGAAFALKAQPGAHWEGSEA